MPYSTVEEVRVILSGLIDPTQGEDPDFTAGHLSDVQIEYEIRNADMQIDIALRRRYQTPLASPVPEVIHNLSIDIAASLCDMTFRGSREYSSDLNPFRIRYLRAAQMIDRIAEGAFVIYNEGEGPANVNSGSASVFNPYPGDVLLTKEVFPRGIGFDRGAEYSETEYIPYYPYLRRRNG